MNFWKQLKQYPVVILFFVFLFGFAILDALWPCLLYTSRCV